MAKSKKSKSKKLISKSSLWSRNGLIFVLIFGAIGGAILWKTLAATSSSIVVDQPSPQFGQQITLTAIYPSEARKKIGRRQMFQPQINLSCQQNGAVVYYQVSGPGKETNLGGGWWQGTSGLFTLGGNSSVGGRSYSWPSGPATCSGFSGYFTTDSTSALYWHTLATVDFQVN